jgi:selenide,water dikinase
MVPAGCYRNRDYCQGLGIGDRGLKTSDELLPLFDPQTSGGLLIAVPLTGAERFAEEAHRSGISAVRVGEVLVRGERAVDIT